MGVSKILKADGLPFPARKNAWKYEKLMSVFLIITAFVLACIQGTSGEEQPNLTTVETWGDTQIKVTWEPFEHVKNKPYHYELYIDDHLEYFGNDLLYVARRLTPDTIYHFKLRSCIQNTNECSQYSKTLSGTTAQSQKRGFFRSFIQWSLLWLIVIILICTTTFIGVKISRKLWRSFLYRYDYRSDTSADLLKHLRMPEDDIDDETVSSPWVEIAPKPGCKVKTMKSIHNGNSWKGKHTSHQEVQENKSSSIVEEDRSYDVSEQCDITVDSYLNEHPKTFELKSSSDECFVKSGKQTSLETLNENLNDNEHSEDKKHSKNEEHLLETHFGGSENLSIKAEFLRAEKPQNTTLYNGEDQVIERNSSSLNRVGQLPDKRQKPTSFDGQVKTQPEHLEKYDNFDNVKHDPFPNLKSKIDTEIVVVIDNSNIFIGAQECASLLNPKERKRHIRVKIQQLVKVFERGRTLSRAFVQGSSPPTTEQVWEVYRRLGYCVDLEDRRGKDEQRVDEGLHLHIYKAVCELSPRKLVIASGDGNKGKSGGATSFPGCAQAAMEKGWQVEVHSWQHALSSEWLKLSRKYPIQMTIHYLDRYINHITFVDGRHGRRCQSFPTDFFKNSS